VASIKPERRSVEWRTIKSRVSMWIEALTAHEAVERWRPELIKRRSSKGRWGPHVEQGRWPPRVKRWMAKRPIVKGRPHHVWWSPPRSCDWNKVASMCCRKCDPQMS